MAVGKQRGHLRYRRYVAGIGHLYQKKQARVYTGIILSIFAIAFFGFFAIRPTLVTISGLIKEINDKKELVAQMDQKINALAKAQTNYAQIEDDLFLIDESLPHDPQLSVLIKQLESLARLSSVTLESVRFEKTNLQGESEKEEVQEIKFNFALSGDYPNLKQFLNSLDTLRRVVQVESFGFSSKTKEEALLLSLTVSAKAHYLIQD